MKFEILLNDGKYLFKYDHGKMETLRYGELWRVHCGDNLIGAMALRIKELEEQLEQER